MGFIYLFLKEFFTFPWMWKFGKCWLKSMQLPWCRQNSLESLRCECWSDRVPQIYLSHLFALIISFPANLTSWIKCLYLCVHGNQDWFHTQVNVGEAAMCVEMLCLYRSIPAPHSECYLIYQTLILSHFIITVIPWG